MRSVTSAKYGQALHALQARQESPSYPVSLGVRGCSFPAEKPAFCALKAAIYTSSEGGEYAFGKLVLLNLKILLPHPPRQGLSLLSSSSTQISCPGWKGWHFGSWHMLHFPKEPSRTARLICSCVQQRGSWVPSWCWHVGGRDQARQLLQPETLFSPSWGGMKCGSVFLRQALFMVFCFDGLLFRSLPLSYFHTRQEGSSPTRPIE